MYALENYRLLDNNHIMNNLLILQVIVEKPTYLKAMQDFWDTETQIEFKNYIRVNFLLDDIIPDYRRSSQNSLEKYEQK